MNDHEAERIAAAIHELRPDWPASSIKTLVMKHMANKPRRDVCVALAWIACESNTSKPARVLENGPWWKAAGIEGSATKRDEPDPIDRCSVCALHRGRCRQIWAGDHDFQPSLGKPDLPVADIVQSLKQHIACEERPEPAPEPEVAPDPNVARLREAISTPEPEPIEETLK